MGALDIPPRAEDRATEFKAVDGQGEHYNGYTLMVEAYAAIWLIMMVWLLFIWRKATSLNARIDGLERAIARAESGAAKKASAPKEDAT